ncbi:hypothetical protein [Flavobacterium sp. UBA7663]|uniref:hypothetical protein n=1 Tax=Flavobacterium sp. UBA7663 TaxID=1946557 RepID=UPI0025C45727|nr:hypothetical protein [Flavobacterium sp. UBA7663]
MDDFQELLNLNLPFVKRLLIQYGEFYPLAVAINNENQIEQILLEEIGELDKPASHVVIAELKKELRWRKLNLKASAIFYDVKIDGNDAIAVAVEHKTENQFFTFYYRYELIENGIEIIESWKSQKPIEIFD